MNTRNNQNRIKFINLKDAAHILGLPIESIPGLVKDIGCKVINDEWDDPCISYDDFNELHENQLVVDAANDAFRNEAERRLNDSTSGANQHYLRDIKKKIVEYRTYINILEKIHAKYLPRFQPILEQNPLMAAYLLYSKVINLLNMGCSALEAGYWNAGLVFRQIDEAIDLAEYFSCSDSTLKLQHDVLMWFRENRTPQPVKIREANAAREAHHFSKEEAKRNLYNKNEVYQKKSKWVHPTFSPIRENLQTIPSATKATVTGFDYGPCSYPRKLLELTLFYRSSIWTAVQGFILCFQQQIPLDAEDAKRLNELNRRFNDESDGL